MTIESAASTKDSLVVKRNTRTVLLLALWVVFSATLGYLYSRIPPDPDESLFDYVGWVLTLGGVPYRDAGDHDFPGMFFLHAIARFLFRSPMWSFRSFDYLLLLGFCGLVYPFLARHQGKLVALIFVPLYQAMYVTTGFWATGQRDLIGTHLALGAGFLFLERLRGGRVLWVCGAASLLWAAIMVKPIFSLYFPILCLIDLVTKRRTNRSLLVIIGDQVVAGAVVASLTLGLMGIAWASGFLQEGIDLALRFNSEVYGRGRRGLFDLISSSLSMWYKTWYWYCVYSAVGLYLWWKQGDRLSLLVIVCVLMTTYALMLLQGKGFGYHLAGVAPILGLLTANCLGWLGRLYTKFQPRDPRKFLVALPCILALVGLEKKLYDCFSLQFFWQIGAISSEVYFEQYNLDDAVDMAAYVRSHSKPTETVWSFNTRIIVNVLAERRLPVRFAHPLIVVNANPPFSRASEWKKEIETTFRDHPPKFIVLSRERNQPGYSFLVNLNEASASRLVEEAIQSRYKLVYSAGTLRCFELSNPAEVTAPLQGTK